MGAVIKLEALEQPKNLALIRSTVAKDCDVAEFDTFIHTCKHVGLDPLRRQIYCFVFSKDDPKRRRMTIVTAIDGYRAIANRTGCYRPDEDAPRITYDEAEKGPHNPLGIVKAEVSVWKFSHGEWFKTTADAYWDEYAPIIEEQSGGFEWVETGEVYEDSGKPKRRKVARDPNAPIIRKLDPTRDSWIKKGRVMIAKCAEAIVLRKAFPDDFAGVMAEDEIEQQRIIDITPSEAVEQAEADRKLAMVGGKDAITVDWCSGGPLERIPIGQFADKALAYISRPNATEVEAKVWWSRNAPARAEFKAKRPSEYLDFYREFEAVAKRIADREVDQTNEAAE